jgi:hypothetical protein
MNSKTVVAAAAALALLLSARFPAQANPVMSVL